jgi:hypothetical protein
MKRLGWCHHCKQWCSLGKDDWLPAHDTPTGKTCPDAHFSYWELKYELENETEAREMAQMIVDDKGNCLYGGGRHSMNCGDGDRCESERLRRSIALAHYMLNVMFTKES